MRFDDPRLVEVRSAIQNAIDQYLDGRARVGDLDLDALRVGVANVLLTRGMALGCASVGLPEPVANRIMTDAGEYFYQLIDSQIEGGRP